MSAGRSGRQDRQPDGKRDKTCGRKDNRSRKRLLDTFSEDKGQSMPIGKLSIKELIGQNQGVSNIDISRTDYNSMITMDRPILSGTGQS